MGDPYASLGVSVEQDPNGNVQSSAPNPKPEDDPYSQVASSAQPPSADDIAATNAELRRMFHSGAPTADIIAYGKAHGVDPNPDQLEHARKNGMDVQFVQPEQPGIGEQLVDATKNDVAGIAQGAAALPDMAASGAGKIMSIIPNLISQGLSAAGHNDAAKWVQDNVTHPLANPAQIGDAVEKVAPTPDTTSGKVNRFIGQMVGGAVTVPASAVESTVARVVGDAPKIPVVAKVTGKTLNQDFAQAAERQGVDYMAADLPKAPKSKFATALSSLTIGGVPLAEQGEKNVASAAAAVDRAAGDIGSVSDKTGAGQAAQRGARQFMGSTEKKMGDLYDAIPISATAPAVVSNTRSALTDLSNSFASNPKLAAAFKDPRISSYLDALTPQATKESTGLVDSAGQPITRDVQHGGGLSWNDLKDFRTRVGKIIGQPGLTSDGVQIGQLRSLYGALSSDMKATAGNYGPAASRAFERANTYARARSDRIDNVVSMLLGKDDGKAPQSAFEAMQRLASDKGGDPLKLARALRSMPEEEAGSVRATMLDDLGNASAGRQSDKGDVFSPAQFVTNWNKLSARAKNVLFTGEHRQALDDLVKVFSGMKSSSKFANSSKTGISVIAATHTLPAIMANPVLGALDVALQYGGGKLLSSPAFARRIAATPMSKAGARAFWSRPAVNTLMAKNPVIAGEIVAFQHKFLNAANDNLVSSAAASPETDQQKQQ